MKLRIALVLIVLATIARILPHPFNFTPMGAIALFGAAYLGNRGLMVAVPFLSLFISDLYLNNVTYREFMPGFTWFSSVFSYISFALIVLAGVLVLNQKVSALRIAGSSLGASLIFFLVSNFGVWFESGMYAHTFDGLMLCYAAGLPFLKNTIFGDLAYSTVMFGSFALLTRRSVQTV